MVLYHHGFVGLMEEIGVFKGGKMEEIEEEFTRNFWLGLLGFQFTQNMLDDVDEVQNESIEFTPPKIQNESVLSDLFADLLKILL